MSESVLQSEDVLLYCIVLLAELREQWELLPATGVRSHRETARSHLGILRPRTSRNDVRCDPEYVAE